MPGKLEEANTMIIDEWKGCYPSSWRGIITPESFQHPAKASSKLAANIYKHAIEQGWLHEGSRCVDPFGGIGGFAFHAMLNGMDMTLVELEPRFVALAQANIDAWNAKYAGRLARWGTARIIQGDSRHLAQVIGVAEACISSPPFSTGDSASAQSIEGRQDKSAEWIKSNTGWATGYGTTPGNLGNLPPGNVDAVISSPPYADGAQHTGGEDTSPEHIQGGDLRYVDYGQTPGQLASLPPGAFEACLSSPPFEESNAVQGGMQRGNGSKLNQPGDRFAFDNQNNLGNDSGDTFWSAAREIVAQVFQVLAPGAHAIWVVKAYVKNKQLVDFPHQWQQLCESCGFVTLHEHHALLVRHNGTSITLEGENIEHKTESKSFFRRLAEKNGSPRIDYETVLCMVKPGGSGGGWDAAISSPPFTDSLQNSVKDSGLTFGNARYGHKDRRTDELVNTYGSTPGQLGSMPPGSLDDARRGGGG